MSATLTALKALADSSRLDVVGLLAQQPRSGDELATILNLTPSTISHHVARLQAAGLVSASAQQYYRIYTLNTDALRSLAKELVPEAMAGRMGLEASVDSNAYAAEILARWLKDNRLQGIPRKSHHKQIVLEWLTRKFAPDQRYDTDQVNETMEQWCRPEYCTELIRLLISDQYFGRLPDGSWYWRADSPAARQPGFDPSSLPIAQSPDPLRFTATRAALRRRDPEGVYAELVEQADVPNVNRELKLIAFRLKRNKRYTAEEIDAHIHQYQRELRGEPSNVRAVMVEQGLLHCSKDGLYWRDVIRWANV